MDLRKKEGRGRKGATERDENGKKVEGRKKGKRHEKETKGRMETRPLRRKN